MILGALGGPNTFGGDAANLMAKLYPEFDKIVYFERSDYAAIFRAGQADAMCAPQQTSKTGFHWNTQQRLCRQDSKLFVMAEVTHTYHCSLLAKPGATITQIKKVLGHTGSITQSRDWITQNIPGAEIVIVTTNSFGAASEALSSDGSVASVGSPGMAKESGLHELAKEIDGGSVAAYWAMGPKPRFRERPDIVVVCGRFAAGKSLTDLVAPMGETGFKLANAYAQATGVRIFDYDYALRFTGSGALSDVQSAVAPHPGLRLAGAFESRS